jgi:hypothetical protein
MRDEREVFFMKIMDREAFFIPYTLGKIVVFLMLRARTSRILVVGGFS